MICLRDKIALIVTVFVKLMMVKRQILNSTALHLSQINSELMIMKTLSERDLQDVAPTCIAVLSLNLVVKYTITKLMLIITF